MEYPKVNIPDNCLEPVEEKSYLEKIRDLLEGHKAKSALLGKCEPVGHIFEIIAEMQNEWDKALEANAMKNDLIQQLQHENSVLQSSLTKALDTLEKIAKLGVNV